jgi:hypothetical protein
MPARAYERQHGKGRFRDQPIITRESAELFSKKRSGVPFLNQLPALQSLASLRRPLQGCAYQHEETTFQIGTDMFYYLCESFHWCPPSELCCPLSPSQL